MCVDEAIMGLSEIEAKTFVEKEGYTLRVVQREGAVFCCNREFNYKRITVKVEHGIVVHSSVG
jgi:hypothetical protein